MDIKGRMFKGRYEAKGILGEGGMGRVYLAYDCELERNVVIKVMHANVAADPKFRERFEAEKKLTAKFEHIYAVRVYDHAYDEAEGPCIVMEFIRGVSLDQLLRNNKGRLSPGRVGRLLYQLCEVLQAAHSMKIVHRDLKPANIMVVEPDTPREKIKVMDFGLATLRGTQSLKKVADSGGEFAVGTPIYMCPEQVKGEEMDHRGDLYSVGVILYELLTGRPPFTGTEAMDVMLAHATDAPPAFADIGVDWVPPSVEAVVQACLAKDKNQRPTSAHDLAERFKNALECAEDPPPPEVTPEQPRTGESAPSALPTDPNAVIHRFEAWMPETIAAHKLKGFVHDAGGEVLESVPGCLRVRLGKSGTRYTSQRGPLSWIGISRKADLIDLELRMEPADPTRKGLLNITVLMRSPAGQLPKDFYWHARCNRVFIELRGYLMGKMGDGGE